MYRDPIAHFLPFFFIELCLTYNIIQAYNIVIWYLHRLHSIKSCKILAIFPVLLSWHSLPWLRAWSEPKLHPFPGSCPCLGSGNICFKEKQGQSRRGWNLSPVWAGVHAGAVLAGWPEHQVVCPVPGLRARKSVSVFFKSRIFVSCNTAMNPAGFQTSYRSSSSRC